MVVQNVLNEEDIAYLKTTPLHPNAVDCNDRHKKLEFKHSVHRIERAMKADPTGKGQEVYYKVLRAMAWADKKLWGKLTKYSKVYPEVEFITYDCSRDGKPKFIEPHVDNDSVVTVVAALSDPSEYVGGISMFRGDGRGGKDRTWTLGKGDAVFFRGESLLHWVTPITEGRRDILQIELSKK